MKIKMKNIVTVLIVLFTTSLMAQTHEILKHNGEKLEVNFIKSENNLLYYSNPTSFEEHKVSIYAVAQLIEKSKNIPQSISENIQLNKKSDYKKVIILKESETIGLKKTEEISSFIGKAKGQPDYVIRQMVENRLKQKAASKGQPFIVIFSNDTENLKAITYTY
jgi:hypothetical protein